MNFIGLLVTILNKNLLIIWATNYIMRLFFTKKMKDIEAKMLTNFIIKKLFMYYELLKKLLLDKYKNLFINIIKYYL